MDDFATPMDNGQRVETGDEFGRMLNLDGLSFTGLDAAVFDSNPVGPNLFSLDPESYDPSFLSYWEDARPQRLPAEHHPCDTTPPPCWGTDEYPGECDHLAACAARGDTCVAYELYAADGVSPARSARRLWPESPREPITHKQWETMRRERLKTIAKKPPPVTDQKPSLRHSALMNS